MKLIGAILCIVFVTGCPSKNAGFTINCFEYFDLKEKIQNNESIDNNQKEGLIAAIEDSLNEECHSTII